MARPRSRLNDEKSEVIEENFLKPDPAMLPTIEDPNGIVIVKKVPKIRKIIFLNGRDPGHPLEFHYASATLPLKHYTLYHGKQVDLPEEIIEHLENCAEMQYGYQPGLDGHPSMYVKGHKYIFQCKSVRQAA